MLMSCLPVAEDRTAMFLLRALPLSGARALRRAMSSVCLAVMATFARSDLRALMRHALILAPQF
eukprot:13656003-Alexandrium_andersonii.AAC.1